MPTRKAVRCRTLGSLSNDDGDWQRERQKAIGLDWQNNTFARASSFWCTATTWKCPISCLVDDMNTRQRLSSSFLELWYSLLEFNSRNICQHLTNWTSWNKRDKVWSSANSLYKWRFRSNRHLCCLSSLATVWPATVQNWNKSFTHIKNRAWAVGREGMVNLVN